jgi:hypothetical protein
MAPKPRAGIKKPRQKRGFQQSDEIKGGCLEQTLPAGGCEKPPPVAVGFAVANGHGESANGVSGQSQHWNNSATMVALGRTLAFKSKLSPAPISQIKL